MNSVFCILVIWYELKENTSNLFLQMLFFLNWCLLLSRIQWWGLKMLNGHSIFLIYIFQQRLRTYSDTANTLTCQFSIVHIDYRHKVCYSQCQILHDKDNHCECLQAYPYYLAIARSLGEIIYPLYSWTKNLLSIPFLQLQVRCCYMTQY